MNADIAAILRDVFRVGKVVETDPEKCTARVTFPDTDEVISAPLQVAQRKTLIDKDYWMPDIDELVACVFLGNGPIAGFILFAIYNDIDTPPVTDQDKRYVRFADETHLEYDRKKHELNANIKGNVIVDVENNDGANDTDTADGTADVTVKDAITIKGKSLTVTIENEKVLEAKEITIKASGDITIEAGANITIKSTGNAVIESTGNMDVNSTGNMTLSPTAIFKLGKMTPAAPGQGPLNCMPVCPMGPPHGGNTVA
jgi:phage baseplate assembly protein V